MAALRDGDKSVRATTAEALEKLAPKIPAQDVAQRTARALWWRLTDWEFSAWYLKTPHVALRQVANRLAELEPPPKASLPRPPTP
jgi:hypothetical protein